MRARSSLFVLVVFFTIFLIGLSKQAVSVEIGPGGGMNKPVKPFKEIRKENIVSQTLDFSCGPASLATMLSYYFGDKVSEEEIIKYLLLSTDLEKVKKRQGFSLLDLKHFAEYKGYHVVGYKMDLDYLVKLDKPVLLPVNIGSYSHFVIFRGLKASRVFLADPAMGNISMRVEKFQDLWQDGIGLVLSRADGRPAKAPLRLTKEEEALCADPRMIRRLFGSYPLGKIYGQGEF